MEETKSERVPEWLERSVATRMVVEKICKRMIEMHQDEWNQRIECVNRKDWQAANLHAERAEAYFEACREIDRVTKQGAQR